MKTVIDRIWSKFAFVLVLIAILIVFTLVVGFTSGDLGKGKYETYTIVEADNLWSIAEDYTQTAKETQHMVKWMSDHNPIMHENKLEVGQEIVIPVKKKSNAHTIYYAKD
ncbi:cell division suppressor protein YneA [Brochothrix campestris]|uniref:Peptidoglycan-binding domain-containing protein n=1 Tax=Brochothrix campestris FSL F6-1037 TaxID=1265861 RepID=W7CZI4_9LIST|nr:LysM peptidoglycan-binding domain-containing protein [Brochothrix campestris]EUJ41176.1 peptidoglycan-binding domain-containing protein [Brochothrix campestris FSL F6-1037]